MKQYIKMVIFIFVLGAVSAGLLIGVDALTSERIEQNKKYELYSAILDANEISYTQSNFVEVFNDNMEIIDPLEGRQSNILVYRRITNDDSGFYSFEFSGNAMWGPMKGVLTLEADFKTIVKIKILDQEETPGLGARIGEEEVLARFIGKTFPNIVILKTLEELGPNEVYLGLTGATNTSGKVQSILNTQFMEAYRTYFGDDLDDLAKNLVYIEMLAAHGVEANNNNFEDLLEATFDIVEDGELTLYIDNVNGLVSFITTDIVRFDQTGDTREDVTNIITLESDKQTVRKITPIYTASTTHEGKTYFLDVLDAKGAKFPDIQIGKNVGPNGINNTASVTHTVVDFKAAINNAYDRHLDLLNSITITGGDFTNEYKVSQQAIEQAILKAINKENSDFNSVVIEVVKDQVYVDADQKLFTYVLTTQMRFGYDNETLEEVAVVVTLKEDLETIHNIQVIYNENGDHLAKEILFEEDNLLNANGVKFLDYRIEIVSVGGGLAVNELLLYNSDASESVLKTANELRGTINRGYYNQRQLISEIDFDDLFNVMTILSEQGYDTQLSYSELKALYETEILVFEGQYNGLDYEMYINDVTGVATYVAKADLIFGNQNNQAQIVEQEVIVYMTLNADFETIKSIKVFYPEGTQWGKTRLLTEENLAKLVGQKFPNLVIRKIVDGKDQYLDTPNVTVTGVGFETLLNDSYDYYLEVLENKLNLNLENINLYKQILTAQGYILDISIFDIENYFESQVDVVSGIKDLKEYTMYINKFSNKVTYVDGAVITFGNQGVPAQIVHEQVDILVTLASDFETILNVKVSYPEEVGTQWGKSRLLTEENIAKLIGMKFPNLVIKEVVEGNDHYLNTPNVSTTGPGFEALLNDSYNFYIDLILDEFEITKDSGKTIVKNKVSNNISFYFDDVLRFGNQDNPAQIVDEAVTIYVTLQNDFETITNVTVVHLPGTQWGKTRLFTASNLSNLVGMKFPNLGIKNPNGNYLDAARVTVTGDGFENSLNTNYDAFANIFKGGNN